MCVLLLRWAGLVVAAAVYWRTGDASAGFLLLLFAGSVADASDGQETVLGVHSTCGVLSTHVEDETIPGGNFTSSLSVARADNRACTWLDEESNPREPQCVVWALYRRLE